MMEIIEGITLNVERELTTNKNQTIQTGAQAPPNNNENLTPRDT